MTMTLQPRLLSPDLPAEPPLTVLSFGGGQDSTALFWKYVYDPEFRKKYAPHDFLVVMSDTGDEHPHTYVHVRRIAQACRERGIPFALLTKEMGYHIPSWPSLIEFYRSHDAIGSKRYPKSCTVKLKIEPVYKYVAGYLERHYVPLRRRSMGHYTAFLAFLHRFGPVRMLIGIAAGEERRIDVTSPGVTGWIWDCVERRYPLVELGMDRRGCQEYIRSVGEIVPWPSNCMRCPFLSEVELVWLERFYPEQFREWVELERRKLEKHREKPRNLGVWGEKDLLTVLTEAKQRYGEWSDERLNDWKFSHGHCVASRY